MLKVIFVTLVFRGVKLTPRGISASKLARNKIPAAMATLMFSGSNFSMVISVTLPDEIGSQKSKMAAEIMYVSQLIYMIATLGSRYKAPG